MSYDNITYGSFAIASPTTLNLLVTMNPDTGATNIGYSTGNIRILGFGSGYGNTIFVDQIFGDDSTGQRGGSPFATINAAILVVQAGDCIHILPGIYNELITIPDNVTIRGYSKSTTTIQLIGVISNTDLITMGNSCALIDLNLKLQSSSSSVSLLRCIVFPGDSLTESYVRDCYISVENSIVTSGTTDLYGIHSISSGMAGNQVDNVRSCTITVQSQNDGSKRGILIDTNAGLMNVRNTNIILNDLTFDTVTSTYYGIESNMSDSVINLFFCSINGYQLDISLTQGTIALNSCQLINSTANGLPFASSPLSDQIIWVIPGVLPTGTNYMSPGTASASSIEIPIYIPSSCIIKSMSLHANIPPGGNITDTWILRNNFANTSLLATLTGSHKSNIFMDSTITYTAGLNLSVLYNKDVSSNISDVVCILLVY